MAVGTTDHAYPWVRFLRVPLQALFSAACSTFMLDSGYSQGLSRLLMIKLPWPNFMHILYMKLNYLYFFNASIIMCLGCGKGCPFSLFCAGIIHICIESLSEVKANSSGQCYVLH